jgi:hypothetical protein
MAANHGSSTMIQRMLHAMKTGSMSTTLPAVRSAHLTKGIQRKLGFCPLAIVLGLLTLPSHAQTFTVLHNFKGGPGVIRFPSGTGL